jgi:hypothetical protein
MDSARLRRRLPSGQCGVQATRRPPTAVAQDPYAARTAAGVRCSARRRVLLRRSSRRSRAFQSMPSAQPVTRATACRRCWCSTISSRYWTPSRDRIPRLEGGSNLVSRLRSSVDTEGGDAPGAQGARRAHTGSMQPTSNAAPRDAAPAECNRTSETRTLATAVASRHALHALHGLLAVTIGREFVFVVIG